MSYNDNDVKRSIRHHRPAIIGIVLAVLVVVIAYIVFPPSSSKEDDALITNPPADMTVEGADNPETRTPEIAPDADNANDADAQD